MGFLLATQQECPPPTVCPPQNCMSIPHHTACPAHTALVQGHGLEQGHFLCLSVLQGLAHRPHVRYSHSAINCWEM